MKEFWNTIQLIFAGIGGWLGYFLEGCDGFLYALIVFVVIDYITGVMCAINNHTLSSEVGFKGIPYFSMICASEVINASNFCSARSSSDRISSEGINALLFWIFSIQNHLRNS